MSVGHLAGCAKPPRARQDFACQREQTPSRRRELDVAGRPYEEALPEVLFQTLDSVGECGGR